MEKHQEKSEFELVKDLFSTCFKHWYYFVISFAVCLGFGILYLKVATTVFSIESKVLLRSENSSGLSEAPIMKSLGLSMGKSGSISVSDEANMMCSYGNLKKLITRLKVNNSYTLSKYWGFKKIDLYDHTPIAVEYSESLPDTLPGIIKFTIKREQNNIRINMKLNKDDLGTFELKSLPGSISTSLGEFKFNNTPYFNQYGTSFDLTMLILSYNIQAQLYEKMILVESEKKSSDILNLKISDSNISRGTRILSTLVDTHNDESKNEKNLVGSKMTEFIEKRLLEVGGKLETADETIKEFKQKNKLTDIEADATAYLDQSTDIMPKMVEARSKMEMAKALDDFISDPKNENSPIPMNAAIGSEALTEIIGQYNLELIKKNEVLQSSKKLSPMSQSISTQLSIQRKNLQTSLRDTRKGLQVTTDNLNNKYSELENRFTNFASMEKQYLSMKREQEIQQAVYLYLQQKKEELSITSVSVLPKLRVIDEPHPLLVPESPRVIRTLVVIFFLGGILIPLSLIYLNPFFKNLFRRKKNDE